MAAAGAPVASTMGSVGNVNATRHKPVVFTGHNAYMMSVARVCREALKFTDVTFICPDGKVVAHRLILAAASSTLRNAFLDIPANDAEGLSEYTILVPDVRKSIVASLVDFLYTGKLIISRSNSRDLQLLVRLLGIDPENVRVEALEESGKKRLVQSQLTTSMGLMVKQGSPVHPATTLEESIKTLPSRAAKRRSSQENGSGGKSPCLTAPSTPTATSVPPANLTTTPTATPTTTPTTTPTAPLAMAPIGSGFGKNGKAKRPSRPTRPSTAALPISPEGKQEGSSAAGLFSGYHDMANVETWVCAICHLYDPATTAEGENSGDTTEWIGCDCNRWYHKFCTGLAVVDESFCCDQVKLKCLPPSPTKK